MRCHLELSFPKIFCYNFFSCSFAGAHLNTTFVCTMQWIGITRWRRSHWGISVFLPGIYQCQCGMFVRALMIGSQLVLFKRLSKQYIANISSLTLVRILYISLFRLHFILMHFNQIVGTTTLSQIFLKFASSGVATLRFTKDDRLLLLSLYSFHPFFRNLYLGKRKVLQNWVMLSA